MRKSEERTWAEYLFQEHPEPFLKHWAKRLKYFRFVREYGGHGSPPDKILLSLKYDGQNDLLILLQSLEIKYQQFAEKPAQPVQNQKYSGQELAKFPSLVPDTEWVEQPKHQAINNISFFVWCYKERVEFTISGTLENRWHITEMEFENAERLEPLFENHVQRIIDPPEDTKYCICPKYYPQYWAAG